MKQQEKKSDRSWLSSNTNKMSFAYDFYSGSSLDRLIFGCEATKAFAWDNVLHFDIIAGRLVMALKQVVTCKASKGRRILDRRCILVRRSERLEFDSDVFLEAPFLKAVDKEWAVFAHLRRCLCAGFALGNRSFRRNWTENKQPLRKQ